MNAPDFICIGAQKAGTTWLYEMLCQNPSVWLPPIKEVHYFDQLGADEETKDRRRKKLMKLAKSFERTGFDKGSAGHGKGSFVKSLAGDDILTEGWYRRIFSHPDRAGRISGEITPAYLGLGQDALETVKVIAPTARFVLLVREPVSRAMSQIRMMVTRSEKKPATPDEWNHLANKVIRQGRGDYANSIPRWLSNFGEDRVMLFPFGDIKSDPAKLLAKVESHIGARPFENYTHLQQPIHTTKPVQVPDTIRNLFESAFLPQRVFLENLMGTDFLARTY